jgi:hypothetical protein
MIVRKCKNCGHLVKCYPQLKSPTGHPIITHYNKKFGPVWVYDVNNDKLEVTGPGICVKCGCTKPE